MQVGFLYSCCHYTTSHWAELSNGNIQLNQELWRLYQYTVFVLERCYANQLEDQSSWAVISARNPRGEIIQAGFNRANEAHCRYQLNQMGLDYFRIYGCSPTLDFIEPSYCIKVSSKTFALEFARQYRQNAMFWIEADQLWLVPIGVSLFQDMHLGCFAERIQDIDINQFKTRYGVWNETRLSGLWLSLLQCVLSPEYLFIPVVNISYQEIPAWQYSWMFRRVNVSWRIKPLFTSHVRC